MKTGGIPEGRQTHGAMYPLLKRFSLLSAVALGVVAVLVVLIYRSVATAELARVTEAQNAVLTRAIANSVWPRIADHVARADEYTAGELAARPETQEIADLVAAMTAGLPIARVKVYGPDGVTVYSSDRGQIGSSEADSPEFATALAGTVVTQLDDDFVAADGRTLDVVESYFPIEAGPGAVAGVFEVYTDVTAAAARIRAVGWQLSVLLLVVFGGLFVALRMVVANGDRTMRHQYDRLLRARERSRGQNAALALEVANRTRAEAELRTARDAAEAGNRAKTEFLANMSHELRTPLNAIIGFSDAILNEAFGAVRPARYRGYVRDIHRSGHHLLDLVDSILDLAKLEAGRMEAEAEWFVLGDLVAEVTRTVAPQVERNRNRLTVEIDGDVEPVLSDPGKVRTILLNVLGNAAKFTERGEISLTVQRGQATGADTVVIRVADTGGGIDPARIDSVFEDFATESAVVASGGSGLGLSIAKRFCGLLGGRIDLASTPGAGTVVTVILPAGAVAVVQAGAAAVGS